ncbi:oligoendopeptidase F family protein [Gemmiger formicilis]|nr:oligoendopeptidase F family protein [Gemmiger formicilis]
MLGVDALHFYDVYAPLVGDLKKSYSYETAQEMVLKAVAPLGEDYQATVRKAYAERWIDVYPNRGKRGGAYSGGCYDSNPYILLNFSGTLDSVSTLAHEMGHTIHSWRSRQHQPPQYADYTLFVAEVASTVNENLLIEQLLANENDPQTRLYLLNQYLENFKGTVYRQTMFAEFEREAHAMVERGEALNAAALNALYKRLVTDYFGNDMVIDDEIQYEWARIPHFYRPFYVYKYATGYSTAVALSEGILKEGEPAVKRYKEFLSMGGSAYPLDELRHAGVDLATPAPWTPPSRSSSASSTMQRPRWQSCSKLHLPVAPLGPLCEGLRPQAVGESLPTSSHLPYTREPGMPGPYVSYNNKKRSAFPGAPLLL